jgi:hypothetical protein
MNQIIKGLGKGLGQLGQETVEKLVENTGKILDPTITAQELLGDVKPLSDQEMAQKKAEDERKKQEEMARLRQGFGGQGRPVENEMERIRNQKEKEEEEKEKYLEKVKERKEWEQQQQMVADMENTQPKKQHVDKGGNKHKTQQPDASQMSQTAEFKGKID